MRWGRPPPAPDLEVVEHPESRSWYSRTEMRPPFPIPSFHIVQEKVQVWWLRPRHKLEACATKFQVSPAPGRRRTIQRLTLWTPSGERQGRISEREQGASVSPDQHPAPTGDVVAGIGPTGLRHRIWRLTDIRSHARGTRVPKCALRTESRRSRSSKFSR